MLHDSRTDSSVTLLWQPLNLHSSQMCQHKCCHQHMSRTKVSCIIHTLHYLRDNKLQLYLASRYKYEKLIKKIHHCEIWSSHIYANKDLSLNGISTLCGLVSSYPVTGKQVTFHLSVRHHIPEGLNTISISWLETPKNYPPVIHDQTYRYKPYIARFALDISCTTPSKPEFICIPPQRNTLEF